MPDIISKKLKYSYKNLEGRVQILTGCFWTVIIQKMMKKLTYIFFMFSYLSRLSQEMSFNLGFYTFT